MPMVNWRVTFADGEHVDVIERTAFNAELIAITRRVAELGLTVSEITRPSALTVEQLRVVSTQRV